MAATSPKQNSLHLRNCNSSPGNLPAPAGFRYETTFGETLRCKCHGCIPWGVVANTCQELSNQTEYIHCFACGAKTLNIEGESHPYMLSSPGCWAMFCELMNKEFSDERYWRAHQFTVDAYALQHIGTKEDKRALNSVNIHLASLYTIFGEQKSFEEAPSYRKQFSQFYKGKNLLEWLKPPGSFGPLTIYEPWDNDNPDLHFQITRKWAMSVWESWSHQHQKIAELVLRSRK